MRSFYSTYCSRNKVMDNGLLPAVHRYSSKRIQYTLNLAKIDGAQFLILSGEFGLIGADHMIPYYDHLLLEAEVPETVKKVIKQLDSLKMEELTFFHNNLDVDPDVKPYLKVIQQACELRKVILNFHPFVCPVED